MSSPSGAAFTVQGTDPSAGGYDATSAQVVALQLLASPALDVTACIYTVLSSSPGAPAPVFSNGGVASPPTAVVNCTMPTVASTAAHTYQIQCQTNGGAAVRGASGKLDDFSVNSTSRVVAIRNGAGQRKMFVGESVEYGPAGWVEIIDDLVDGVGAAPTNLTSDTLTLGSQTPVQKAESVGVTTPSTDDSVVNLLTAAISIPANRNITLVARVKGGLRTATAFYSLTSIMMYLEIFRSGNGALQGGSPAVVAAQSALGGAPFSTPFAGSMTVTGAADNGSGLVRLSVSTTVGCSLGNTVDVSGLVHTTEGNGTWAVTVVDGTHLDLHGSAFVNAYVGGGGTVVVLGNITFGVIGTAVQIQGIGIKPAQWIQNETVDLCAVRWDSTANRTYVCVQSGTTSGTGTGPSGTGLAIVDGTAKWDFLVAGRSCPIDWLVWDLTTGGF